MSFFRMSFPRRRESRAQALRLYLQKKIGVSEKVIIDIFNHANLNQFFYFTLDPRLRGEDTSEIRTLGKERLSNGVRVMRKSSDEAAPKIPGKN